MELERTIELIRSKDRKAEKALFLRFAPKVLTVCRRYASQEAEAKDFMQECFILLYAKIHQFDAKKGPFEGWMYRLCTNRVLELLRKSKNQISMTFPETLPDVVMTQEEFMTIPRPVILKAIQKLPSGYRQVFNLYVFDGWSHKQIGEALNIAETSSRSQLTRAKKQLQQLLQKKIINHRYEKRLA